MQKLSVLVASDFKDIFFCGNIAKCNCESAHLPVRLFHVYNFGGSNNT